MRGSREKSCYVEFEGTQVCIDPFLPGLRVLGLKYSAQILILLGKDIGIRNFNEISRDIPEAGRVLLASRLRDLEKQGLIERRAEGGHIQYSLTEKGRLVREALIRLIMVL
ncbi:hypothetical protein GCM10007108_00660 [Thermogymnomonas acidicola]|uniref:HTH hxlR-type domain-containing protein n=1 Tax=Thermogymnomonas acidicola TaxID=399579 RepID=A0AA37BPN8_9ARCH|nr:winged helix-turn-helix transcriptional regulator [Thermogymnomonas acidicola]GGM66276.1 hypothetical protein GCM10007108_00660 [Thermogymnomonas acidicola]